MNWPRNGHRLLAALTAVLVSLTAWAAAPGQTAAGAPTRVSVASKATGITWGRCAHPGLRQLGAQCGRVRVPLSYAQPHGRTITLAVSRIRHRTPRSQGVMLVNPGGPGGSGLEFAALGPSMPGGSGAAYDWIGFDPRGVGASRPALSCRPHYFAPNRPSYVPTTPAILKRWLGRSRSFAQGCAKYGPLLRHMRTVDLARDVDRIRAALGARRINYYGFSYGTYLGQVYATMFPHRVRRMVLDSNVDPRGVWYASGEAQTVAFQNVFDLFFRWVAQHRATYRLGRTQAAVERLYLQQRRLLQRRPAGALGPSEWDDAFLISGYLEAAWPLTAQAFADYVHRRDPKPLLAWWSAITSPGNDNQYAAFNATTCADAPWPGQATVVRDARRLYRQAPVNAWSSTWFSGPCMFWPAPSGTPLRVRGRGTSALLVGQTLDAATPFEGSLEVRSIFPRSRLLAIRGGATHGSTPFLSGNCANARIAAYLTSGTLPPRRPGRRPDVSCPAPPKPSPARRGGGSSATPPPGLSIGPGWSSWSRPLTRTR